MCMLTQAPIRINIAQKIESPGARLLARAVDDVEQTAKESCGKEVVLVIGMWGRDRQGWSGKRTFSLGAEGVGNKIPNAEYITFIVYLITNARRVFENGFRETRTERLHY